MPEPKLDTLNAECSGVVMFGYQLVMFHRVGSGDHAAIKPSAGFVKALDGRYDPLIAM